MGMMLCVSHVSGHLQCKKCAWVIAIIILRLANEYSWIDHVFKDLLEMAGRVLHTAVEQRLQVHSKVIYCELSILWFIVLELVTFHSSAETLFCLSLCSCHNQFTHKKTFPDVCSYRCKISNPHFWYYLLLHIS